MEQTNQSDNTQHTEAEFSIKGFMSACARKWRWFVASIIIFMGLGVAYVVTRQPAYERSMSILVQNQDGGGGVGDIASSFSSLGLVSTNTSVYNEMIALKSPAVIAEVVTRLGLNTTYLLKDFPHGTSLYGSNQPFIASMPDLGARESGSFKYDINPDGSGRMYKFVKVSKGDVIKYDGEVKVPAGATTLKTPLGKVVLTANPRYTGTGFDEKVTIVVGRGAFMNTVDYYGQQISCELADRDADVIDLSIVDVSVERADDILNTVLDVYTERWMNDKNKLATATSKFIDERLALIEHELGGVDTEIMEYRSTHLMANADESTRINVEASRKNDEELLNMETQLQMAKYVLDYVKKPSNQHNIIPLNTTGANPALESQIGQYNGMLMTRNNLEASTSANNPIVKDYDSQLKGLREAITRSLDNTVVNIQGQVNTLRREQGELRGQLAESPKQANDLRGMGRQQKVKEQLYLYLLQKREENQLSQTFSADNTRIITPPMGSNAPVKPKKGMILAVCFLLGLALPGAAVYALEATNTKVRTRKDLERMTTPFIGEIPFIGKKNTLSRIAKKIRGRKARKGELETLSVKVERGNRDLVNESFRIIRGNIDFMQRSDSGHVIMVTSFNPGSGKSFITYNLAASFALKDKKVLIIDCDLRHGSTSQYVGMPGRGITNYLTGATDDWQKLVVPTEEDGLYVMPIGHRPPNPAELLDSQRMKELVEQASKDYDYVLLDCPPVDVVVDTQILSPLVDRTVFVVRAGLLEKSAVNDIEELYKNYRFKQMSIILNGTEKHFSKYGTDGRGYYGDQYGAQ